ncbi:glucosamine-6-phosphate deaminase [Tepidibacillus marianensis]|uniref:glucosamine-6-phosphate deaminase n=1 Tax=Tepidibacillus marianensis TaxID=3131995 RepID=UPI0030CEE6DC
MRIELVNNYDELSKSSGNYIFQKMKENKKINMGLATGSTPLGLYQELIRLKDKNGINLNNITTFNLDEYIGVPPESAASYRYYMNNNLFRPLRLPIEQTHIPLGMAEDIEMECKRYEKLIEESGGIDIQILGVGDNGHIGFNEPGTSFLQPTHIVQLTHSTRKANARFFKSIDDVPTKAITMGIQTIMKAKEIVLLASGKAKAEAIFQLIESNQMTTSWPVTILKSHPNVTVFIDEPATLLLSEKMKAV